MKLSEYIWFLKYRNSILRRQVESYQNGNAFNRLRDDYEAIITKKNIQIKMLERDVAKAQNETVSSRKAWSDVFDDLEKEHKKELDEKEREIARLKERVLEVERERDAALDKARDKQKEIYRIGTELEEEKGKNQKLTAQVNKVNYDSSVKAFAFFLSNECNVSCGKIKQLMGDLSEGQLQMSEATINGLSEEFSSKTEPEKKDIITRVMTSSVINTDFTNANVDGETKHVLIIASPGKDAAMFIARDHKGHKGIKGTPLENYVGTMVHDHATEFYKYGMRHQECSQHNCRYAIGSIENEPELKWNKKMHKLIQKMLRYRNSLGPDDPLDEKKVAVLEKQYDKILELAEQEYLDNPPSDYYREGYNLYKRLVKFKESELLFLHDRSVPANNSLAERLARVFKRKQKQMIVFRSRDNFEYV